MTVEQVLDCYLEGKGLSRSDKWVCFLIGGLRIPYFPRYPLRHFLTIHDVHHVITGYSTGIRDEIFLIGWELMSGGWGRHNWRYFGKPLSLVFMFLISPVGVRTALSTGARQHNLYSFELNDVLEMDYEAAFAYVTRGEKWTTPVLRGQVSHPPTKGAKLSPFALGAPRESSKYGDLRACVSSFMVRCDIADRALSR